MDNTVPKKEKQRSGYPSHLIDHQLHVAHELAEEEHYLRTILQTTADGFWVIDTGSRKIVEVNPAYCQMSGYSRDELLQLAVSDVEAMESADETNLRIQEIIAKGFLIFETIHRRKDGSLFDVEVSVTYLNIKGGQFICFCRDISERKMMAKALWQSEEKYRRIYENALVGIFQSSPEGRFLQVNHSFARMLGYASADELVTAIFDIRTQYYANAEDRERYQSIMQEKGYTENFEFKVKKKDGCHVWVSNSSRAIVGREGNILCYEGMVLDITARRSAEEELKRERQRLADIIAGTNVGTWEWNVQTGETIFNERWAEIVGYTLEELAPVSIETWKRLAHPGDLKQSQALLGEHFAGNLDYYEFESRMRHKDGSWVWVLDRGSVCLRSADGQPLLMSGTHQDITARKRAEEALRDSEANFSKAFMSNPAPLIIAEVDTGRIINVNDRWEQLIGYTREEQIGRTSSELGIWAYTEERKSLVRQLLEKGFIRDEPVVFNTKSGNKIQALWSVELIKIAGRQFILGMMYDLTERIKSEQEKEALQRQLFQSQKMESVGRLAGGVAHDFNNMLSVILGHTEMALEQVPADAPLFDDLQEINKSARRSADLTRQLLAFARKQTAAPRILDLNATMDDMLRMLRRLIGERIQLSWLPGSGLWQVKMDASQLDQILANLCVNARDAISGVGTITIATDNAVLNEVLLDEPDTLVSGDYVRLTVSDDGCGMDQQILDRIFEPFFTTKPLGEGTGLGLSTVFGIVKQNAGFVQVRSAPGQGAAFTLYFPRHVMQKAQPCSSIEMPAPIRGSILVVEDEPAILAMTAQILERLGYTVLGAASAGEALRLAREHTGDIDLLMTDVIMPEMHGRDLAKKILALYPRIKRLFMSGYTADVIAEHGVLEEGVNFIQKPFSMKALGAKIRSVLEA